MLTDKKVSYDCLQSQLQQQGDQKMQHEQTLNNQTDELSRRWKLVNDISETHQRELMSLSETSGEFNAHLEKFLHWLDRVESALRSCEVKSSETDSLNEVLEQLMVG